MAPEILHRVCHGSPRPEPWQAALLTIRPAILPSYVRHKVRGCDYPAIVPSSFPGDCVRGTYVTGLTDGDIWRLDTFEGSEYERKEVKVQLLKQVQDGSKAGGEEVVAETYVWSSRAEGLEEGEWDFAEFVREKMGSWVGEDPGFKDVEEAVARERGRDPTRGRGAGGDISKKLEEGDDQEVLESAV